MSRDIIQAHKIPHQTSDKIVDGLNPKLSPATRRIREAE
jgi:hypothetical protein